MSRFYRQPVSSPNVHYRNITVLQNNSYYTLNFSNFYCWSLYAYQIAENLREKRRKISEMY